MDHLTIWRKMALLGVSLAVAAGAAEGALRLVKPDFPGFRLPQIAHRPAAGLGFEMVPGQVGYTAAEPVRINSLGFRGPEVREHRRPGDLRILCLGDSITFGYGVGEDAPYPRQLERLLEARWPHRRPEVINTGVQRYATYQEIDLLSSKGLDLAPDVVVLGVYANDLVARPANPEYVSRYENEREQAAGAFRNRAPWLYLLAKNTAVVELTKEVYLSRQAAERPIQRLFAGELDPRDEARWQTMDESLEEFRRLADAHGFSPLVVTIPARVQVIEDWPRSFYPKRVLELSERHGLPAFDMLEAFRSSHASGIDPYLPWNNHLSMDGHRLVAHALAERLIRSLD